MNYIPYNHLDQPNIFPIPYPTAAATTPILAISNPETIPFRWVKRDFRTPSKNNPAIVIPIEGIIPCFDSKNKKTERGIAAPKMTKKPIIIDE